MIKYSKNTLMDFIKTNPLDIEICDVTLRDGEQTPGVAFTKNEKIDIANNLDEIGVEIIEAGFPVVSSDEKNIVKEIANLGLTAKVCCLSRAIINDIDVALDCDVDVISVFIATSDLHLKYKYHKTCEEATSCALETLEYAKDHGLIVRFAAEDSTRTNLDVLKHIFKKAEDLGADYLSIADTIGILNPSTAYFLVNEIKKVTKTPICIHCHNDLGLALANTLAAAEAGAKQLHTTVNGIGERAGNTPLEELLVSLLIQYGIDRYNLNSIKKLSKMVEQYSGIQIAKNKAIIGSHAFAHESGIHVAAILEEPSTYELFSPELVGCERDIIIGKHTGGKALKHIIHKMGYNLNGDKLNKLLEKVKMCSEAKMKITCEKLSELIKEC